MNGDSEETFKIPSSKPREAEFIAENHPLINPIYDWEFVPVYGTSGDNCVSLLSEKLVS
jgi:hypothetical protein